VSVPGVVRHYDDVRVGLECTVSVYLLSLCERDLCSRNPLLELVAPVTHEVRGNRQQERVLLVVHLLHRSNRDRCLANTHLVEDAVLLCVQEPSQSDVLVTAELWNR